MSAPRTDPAHWGLQEILLDELAQRRPAAAVEPAQAVTKPRGFLARMVDGASDMAGKLVGRADHAGETRWDPALVTDETYRRLHAAKLVALCLSGGGIRSASLGLGIVQALARQRRLSCFDYVSTVSGGGYIGSWLSAWCSRQGQSIATVEQKLRQEHEPVEVANLRDFTSYLTPHNGVLSSDTWAGVATILRNLCLNWLLFLPLFLLMVWVPKVSVFAFRRLGGWLMSGDAGAAAELGLRSGAFWLLGAAGALYFLSALFISRQLVIQGQQGGPRRTPRPYGAAQGYFLAFGIAPAYAAACLASAVLAHLPESLSSPGAAGLQALGPFALAGALLWGLAYLLASWRLDWILAARCAAGAGFGIALALVFALLRQLDPQGGARFLVVLALPGCFLAHLVGSTLFVGLASRVRDHDAIREWSARAGGLIALVGLGWTLYALLVLWDPLRDWPGPFPAEKIAGWEGKLFDGLVTAMGGVAGIVGALLGRSASTSAGEGNVQGGIDWTRVAQLAGLLFFIAVVFELSRLFDYVTGRGTPGQIIGNGYGFHLAIFLVLAIWTSAASFFINVNKFSLHAFYRNRLIRAYLGASNIDRRPSAFTGFDEGDNRKMKELRTPREAPIHVVNVALNLVHGKRLAWQERKASSFTITRQSVGNPNLGYRPAAEYGSQITLGTAMAISGAAVSPNMGYHSSPLLGLLMTLFNVRLGWWLGNPAGKAWRHPGPLQSVGPFLMEVLGLTDDTRRYVYLSDGGHFENLGVYEMLRRRCRTIVAVDAGADPDFQFADLGNAIRKARIDLGVEIRFEPPRPIAPLQEPSRLGLINRPEYPTSSPYSAIGTIVYPEPGCEGKFIYIKAALHGDEPEDIGSYGSANPTFPHESTSDQFFCESQFESYRRLGQHIGLAVFPVPRTEACDAAELAKVAMDAVAPPSAAAAPVASTGPTAIAVHRSTP